MKQQLISGAVGIVSGVVVLWMAPFLGPSLDPNQPGLVGLLLTPVPAVVFLIVVVVAVVAAAAVVARKSRNAQGLVVKQASQLSAERAAADGLRLQIEQLTNQKSRDRAARFSLARIVMSEAASFPLSQSLPAASIASRVVAQQGNTHSEHQVREVVGWLLAQSLLSVDSSGGMKPSFGWEQRIANLERQAV
jgi:uncharacterized membrane protein